MSSLHFKSRAMVLGSVQNLGLPSPAIFTEYGTLYTVFRFVLHLYSALNLRACPGSYDYRGAGHSDPVISNPTLLALTGLLSSSVRESRITIFEILWAHEVMEQGA
jgi:hypothetical protein